MTIQEIIRKRQIEEILHFTTNFGFTGILASKVVKPRKLLTQDKYLEYVYLYNCENRSRDAAWHSYVNLSITKVNWPLFNISMSKWHLDLDGWWCVLSFDPIILTHPGVTFTTTNNIYTGVKRGTGAEALERLFDSQIVQWEGNTIAREPKTPANKPTSEQAEVLYPDELSLNYLEKVYVKTNEDADSVRSMIDTLNEISKIDCIVRPNIFEE
jgi:hypothetical protein